MQHRPAASQVNCDVDRQLLNVELSPGWDHRSHGAHLLAFLMHAATPCCLAKLQIPESCLFFRFTEEFLTALKKTPKENQYLLHIFKLVAPTIKIEFLNMLICIENSKIPP